MTVIEIPQGKLQGTVGLNLDDEKYCSFLGIPYAAPPIGELRFKAPVPASPWSGIRDATKAGPRCYSADERDGSLGGSEDCLHLNVYIKESCLQASKPLPVLVYVHGGAFIGGCNSPAAWGPEFLTTEDIVLVAINYRLGVLGFLYFKDPSLDVPGNAGMKDQVLALKWVRDNIQHFSGNPNDVTVLGHSAGSASVHFLVLSPSARSLFHKVILQSGSALCAWAEGHYVVDKLIKRLEGEVCDERHALKLLQSITVEQVYRAGGLDVTEVTPAYCRRPFAPIVEYPNCSAFLTVRPIEAIASGKYNHVPIMMGYTTAEGIFVPEPQTQDPLQRYEYSVLQQMDIEVGSSTSQLIAKTLEHFYSQKQYQEMRHLIYTDSLFVIPVLCTCLNHLLTSSAPIYLYRISLDTKLNFLKHAINMSDIPGVCHADELGYLFTTPMTPQFEKGSSEDAHVRRFLKLWTNFVKFGNPTPSQQDLGLIWKPVEKDNLHFLDIGEELILDKNPEPDNMLLWKQILELSPNTNKYFP